MIRNILTDTNQFYYTASVTIVALSFFVGLLVWLHLKKSASFKNHEELPFDDE